MAKTLAALQQQIQKLQDQADAIKKKEAVGVIAKIKVAIEAYGLKPEDLFGSAAEKAKRPYKAREIAPKKVAAQKKSPAPPKYTDGTSFWSGHGKRPQWFKDAVESGKTIEDLAVKG
jgi:DNA-binding protein H-NS